MKYKKIAIFIGFILFCAFIVSFPNIIAAILDTNNRRGLISFEKAVSEYEVYVPNFSDDVYDESIHIGEDYYYTYNNISDHVDIKFYRNKELLNTISLEGEFLEYKEYVKQIFFYDNHFVFMAGNKIYFYNTEGIYEKEYINPYTEGDVFFYIGREIFICNSCDEKTKIYQVEFEEELKTVDSLPEIKFTIKDGIKFLSIAYNYHKYIYLFDGGNKYYCGDKVIEDKRILFENESGGYFHYYCEGSRRGDDFERYSNLHLECTNPHNYVTINKLKKDYFVEAFPYERNCLFLIHNNKEYAFAFYDYEEQKYKFSKMYTGHITSIYQFTNRVYFTLENFESSGEYECVMIK